MNENESVSLPRLDSVRVLVLFGGNQIFGSEIGNLEVFRQMATLGLRAKFITRSICGHREIQPALDRLGFEWTTAPFGYHWSKYMLGRHFGYFLLNLYGVIATSWRLWREVRTWKPTHLYCMNWMFFTNAMPAIMWSRLPLIYRAGDELPTHTRFHRWIVEKLLRRVNRAVCVSNFIRQGMLRTGCAEKKLTVLYSYPAGRPRKVSSPKLPAKPPGARVLIYVGRVSEAKGAVVLIEVVERLICQGENVALWVVGSSDQGDKTCDELGKRVEITGNQQRILFLGHVDDVNTLYSQADIHICPSVTTEGLPHVVLEAKQCGKPSVVFPTGGIPELIEHEVDGYVCRAKTAEALAEGIRFFLNDPEKHRLAGEAARRSLEEKFGEQQFRRAWAEVFAESGKAESRK